MLARYATPVGGKTNCEPSGFATAIPISVCHRRPAVCLSNTRTASETARLDASSPESPPMRATTGAEEDNGRTIAARMTPPVAVSPMSCISAAMTGDENNSSKAVNAAKRIAAIVRLSLVDSRWSVVCSWELAVGSWQLTRT